MECIFWKKDILSYLMTRGGYNRKKRKIGFNAVPDKKQYAQDHKPWLKSTYGIYS